MSFLSSKTASGLLVFLLAGLIVWNISLHFSSDHATNANYLYNIGYSLLYLFGAIAGLIAYRTLGGGLVAKAFLYLSLSLFAYTAGQWAWTYYTLFTDAEVPYPSLADLFFVLFIPCTALALFSFLRIYQMFVTKKIVIESVLVFLGASALLIFFQGAIDLSGDIDVLEQFFNLLYPITDAFLITMAVVVIRSSGGTLHRNLFTLVAGYAVGAIGDITFSYRTAQEIYWNGDAADILFTLSGFLMALATIQLTRELVGHKEEAPAIV